MILLCLLCIGFGAAMEILQGMLPTKRDKDVFDWLADIAGTVLGLVFATTQLLPYVFRHEIRKPA